MTETFHQRLSVSFDYPVHFARNVLDPANPLLADTLDRLREGRRHRAIVHADSGLVDARGDLLDRVKEYFHAHRWRMELAAPPVVIAGGERAKNGWGVVRDVMTTAGDVHLDRQSFVIVLGGGAVLDMVGFAASLVHRGLRVVRLPSTTLSQGDGGVGVKNGMDEHGQKNFVGTFCPPFAVINDFDLLGTLADRDWIGGAAEAFKVAVIKDAAFFDWLCQRAADLRARDQAAMEQAVRRCALLHLEHIAAGGDPFELGSARPLDFGHWIAHKLETMSQYALGHRQAVAIGIAADSHYAARTGLLTGLECERIVVGLAACGLPLWSELLHRREPGGELEILQGLRDFQEHLGGRLCVTLPKGIGHKTEVHHVEEKIVEQSLEELARRS